MNNLEHKPGPRKQAKWSLVVVGLGSLIWLLLRSVTTPRRLAYPCQRVALLNSLAFIGYLLSLLGATFFYRHLKRRVTLANIFWCALALLMAVGMKGDITLMSVQASPDLPAWTSPGAVSDVFVVEEVPAPQCSLDGGALPSTPPCNNPEYALPDDGVDALIDLLEAHDTYFHQTSSHPDGIVAANDVVVIKINNQWGGKGSGDGAGRLATNTDVLKGLIWRILQHPAGFSGEIVIAENTQTPVNDWNVYPANAENQAQSFQDVVDVFQSLGYPVSLYSWRDLNGSRISGGSIEDSSYPTGEYIQGNNNDVYILLEDPAGTGTDELSYPKFQTANGTYVSMRYGVWDNGSSSYDADRLTFINLPVLKRHGAAGATSAWKNLIGFTTAASEGARYGTGQMHDFFFGYTGGPNQNYGLLGREIAGIQAPDLNLVDAIWVAYQNNSYGNAIRRDTLLASTDPFAVDWYASEYILLPLTGSQGSSATRSGTFRNTTRINQNSARLAWPGGSGNYPYIDLLDGYDGDIPSDAEKNQLNVYVTAPGAPLSQNLYLPIILK